MKDIIAAIKSTLQGSSSLVYVSDSNIMIEPSNNYLPIHGTFPAITIKDGEIKRKRDWTGQSSGFLTEEKVYINLWQLLLEDDKSIVGSGSTKGVLDLQADIDSILHVNLLGLSCILDVFCGEESAVEVVEQTELTVVRKTMTYTYLKMEVK
jgi:hypothetical protein